MSHVAFFGETPEGKLTPSGYFSRIIEGRLHCIRLFPAIGAELLGWIRIPPYHKMQLIDAKIECDLGVVPSNFPIELHIVPQYENPPATDTLVRSDYQVFSVPTQKYEPAWPDLEIWSGYPDPTYFVNPYPNPAVSILFAQKNAKFLNPKHPLAYYDNSANEKGVYLCFCRPWSVIWNSAYAVLKVRLYKKDN